MEKLLNVIKDGTLKDNIIEIMSKKYYRFLKRQNAKFFHNDDELLPYQNVSRNDVIKIVFDEYTNKDENHFNYAIDIVYENDDYMVINKPSHMNVIPSRREPVKSLYNAIYTYLKDKNRLKTIHIITRLDKETSGLVLVALNKECALYFNKNHSNINKIYLALASGVILDDHFFIEKSIKKSEDSIKRIISLDGKYAKTEFFKIAVTNNNTVLRVKLYTGRTHQIRLHLQSISHPIVGDTLYGSESDRLYLHCMELEFIDNCGNIKRFIKSPDWSIK